MSGDLDWQESLGASSAWFRMAGVGSEGRVCGLREQGPGTWNKKQKLS